MACEKFSVSQDHKSYFFPCTSPETYIQVESSAHLFIQLSAIIWFHQRLRRMNENLHIVTRVTTAKTHPVELRTGALGWRLLGIRSQEGNVQITTALIYSSCFQISFSHRKSQLCSQRKRNSLAGKGTELIWIPFNKDFPSSSDYLQVQKYLIDEHG